MAETITITEQDTTTILGWIIPTTSWDEELPFATVWAAHTGTVEPGTARTERDAWDLVATDAFGECIYWPTQESAEAALRRDHNEVVTEILG